MILEELKLKNFGIYKGTHAISLDSTDPSKPVILIGALNGAGKTTFLDALQLALYGKFAKCSNRGKSSYSTFLEKNINKFADSKEASVAIRFRHDDNSSLPQVFEIERKWSKSDNKDCKEEITVLYNDQPDIILSENWDDIVNNFIPQAISELFFFDGEKIENIADPKRSAEFLKTGIEALLGLESLTQLVSNLKVIKRRKQEKLLNKKDDSEINILKCTLDTLNAEKINLENRLKAAELECDNINVQLDKLNDEFISSGADKLAIKKEIESKLIELNKKKFELEHSQHKAISGIMPFGLLTDMISKCNSQLKLEQSYRDYQSAEKIISEHQQKLLAAVVSLINDPEKEKQARVIFSKTFEELKYNSDFKCYLNSPEIKLESLTEKISHERAIFVENGIHKKDIEEQIYIYQQKMATIPNFEDVKQLFERSIILNEKKSIIDEKKNEIIGNISSNINKSEGVMYKYDQLLQRYNAETFENERQGEIINHINTLYDIVGKFNEKMVSDNIKRLESRIKSKFDQLKRKHSLIERLEIDVKDYSITLYTQGRQILSPDRLSAGERQLFAISILWGLADCSGKELPTIIDTPMGRLDGEHRTRLIKNYFPRAASQVILLSTDEEIYGKYYEDLTSAIAQEYSIVYDEEQKSSYFKSGYLKVR